MPRFTTADDLKAARAKISDQELQAGLDACMAAAGCAPTIHTVAGQDYCTACLVLYHNGKVIDERIKQV